MGSSRAGVGTTLRFLWTLLPEKRQAVLFALLVLVGRLMPPLSAWALTTRVNQAASLTAVPAWALALGGVAMVYAASQALDWGLRLVGQLIFYPLISRLGSRFCTLALDGLLAQHATVIAAHGEARWAAVLDRKTDVAGLVSFVFSHIAPPALEAGYGLFTLWALTHDATLAGLAALGVGAWLVLGVWAQAAIVERAARLLHVQADLGDSTARCARGALLAKVFDAQDFLLQQRARTSTVEVENYTRNRLAQVVSEAAQGLVLALSLAGCFWAGSYGLAHGHVTPGAFAAAMGLVSGCFWQLRNLGYAISGVASYAGQLGPSLALARVGLVQEQARQAGPAHPLAPAAPAPTPQAPSALATQDGACDGEASPTSTAGPAELWLEGVCPTPSQRLRVGAGDKVWLVGPSGAGKTTLALRLMGLSPWPDTVRTNASAWQGRWAWAPQAAPLLPATVWENVALGRTDRATAIATARACALDLDWDAPARESLSGGERLRLATARALCAGRPAMVLDEPTAGLDASGEKQLMAHLVAQPALTVFITHRLNAIPPDARVWVLRDAQVVEAGEAQALLQDPASHYARLYQDFHHHRGGLASPGRTADATPD